MSPEKKNAWKNRIVEQRMMPVAELKANPLNWRKHPRHQAGALEGALEQVGIVQGVIFNQRTSRLIDGHLRVELAVKNKEFELPVTIVDLDEDEEKLVLATLDPIGALADADAEILASLIDEMPLPTNDDLNRLLESIAPEEEVDYGQPPPSVERNVDELNEIRRSRRDGNDVLQNKFDTERFLVIVFASRESKQKMLDTLGLPDDERYISSKSIEIRRKKIIRRVSGGKSAPRNRSGSTG